MENNEDTLELLHVKPYDVIRLYEIPDMDEEEGFPKCSIMPLLVFLGFTGTGLTENFIDLSADHSLFS